MANKKKLLRRSLWGLTFFIGGGLIVLMGLILYPQALFAHQTSYRTVDIYTNSEPDDQIQSIIDSALARVSHSELYDENYQYDLFLAHNTPYNTLDDKLFGSWSAARAIDNNLIVKVRIDLANQIAIADDTQFSMVYMIAHEMIHCLQAHQFGKWTFNPLSHTPMWKLEGYPEYISRARYEDQDSASLRMDLAFFLSQQNKTVNGLIRLDSLHTTPLIYFKGKLMVEYLMEVKGQTYAEILENDLSEEKVWNNLITWYETRNHSDE